ncbi:MAG: hypothetical protein ABI132_05290 [Rhodanobacteraceae bacterium]
MTEPRVNAIPKRRSTRRAKAPIIPLDQPGRLRFANVMALLGISHQTIYDRIKSGAIPLPDGYDGAMPYWKTSTIRTLLET